MCLTPKNQAKILEFAIHSRRRKSGSWARVLFSTENFAQLLGVRTTKATSKLSFIWWIPEEYIPRTIISRPSGSPPPRPYPGSIVDLLDAINPDPNPSQASGSARSVSSRVQRLPEPFPQSFFDLTESTDLSGSVESPPANLSTVPRKRKRADSTLARGSPGGSTTAHYSQHNIGGSSNSSTLSSRQKGKQRRIDSSVLIDSDIIILSDDSASEVKTIEDLDVIVLSDDSAEVEVIEISD